MKNSIYILSLFIALASCKDSNQITEDKQNNKSTADSLVTRVKIAKGEYSIEIDNYDIKNRRPYLPAPLASKYASAFYNRLDTDEKSNIKNVHVQVNSIVKSDEYNYSPADFKRIGPFKKLAEAGIFKLANNDFDGFYDIMDPQYVTKEVFMKDFINRTVTPFPDAFIGITKVKTNGFEITTVEDVKVVKTYSSTVSAKGVEREYEILISDNQQPKIVGVWLDQPK